MMISGDYRAPTLRAKPGGSNVYCRGCRKLRPVERMPWGAVHCCRCKARIYGRN